MTRVCCTLRNDLPVIPRLGRDAGTGDVTLLSMSEHTAHQDHLGR